jgi:hypothetical protein
MTRYSLYLDNDRAVHHQIEPVPTFQLKTAILHRQGDLFLVADPPQRQFSVYLDGRPHDVVG